MTRSSSHIAILGAGLIGLSTADTLLRRGQRVTLIETGARPMEGASFANSGMIHPSQAYSWVSDYNNPCANAAVRELALRSRDLLHERMSALGLDAMRANAPGCFQLFERESDARAVRDCMTTQGMVVQVVSLGDLPVDKPALYYEDDRWGDARAYGEALLASLQARGAEIKAGCDVVLERAEDDQVHLFVDEDRFRTDQIIVAAGVGSVSLLESLALSLPIRPLRGWAVDFSRPEHVALPDVPLMDSASRSALTPFADRIRLSGTMGEDTPEALIKRWSDLMPALDLQQKSFDLVWSGERPVSELGRPIIDKTPLADLWVNAGHGHMGWTLCAGSAEYLAKLMLDGATSASFAYPLQ
ncbi:MAG: FAD-dependent oxidoreductase [Pseudomonadota bacterium]